MANSEYLDVDGIGSTRALALEHADKQAYQYFQRGPVARLIGRAQAMTAGYDGTVQAWSVHVEYRLP